MPRGSCETEVPIVVKILQPVLWVALAVGVTRLIASLAGAPRALVYLASLTAVEILGSLFFAYRLAHHPGLRYLDLWKGNLLLFGLCQILYIAGLVYTGFSGNPTLYHEKQRLIDFLGYEPSILEHIGMHVLNWMLIAPTLMTWVIDAPLVWWLRRRGGQPG